MKNGFGTPTGPFIREYVNEIKNPQSDFQMDQRAKMLPAVLFRRQLESVISRAWEGKKYGGPSTREFMKYALKEPWEHIPQLPKDSTLPIPGNYLVSRGSLPPVGAYVYGSGDIFTIRLDGVNNAQNATISALSSDLIATGNYLAGDQISLLVASTDANLTFVGYNVWSFFVDESDVRSFSDAGLPSFLHILPDQNVWNFETTATTSRILIGGCLVHSREGNNSHLRSTERFMTNLDFLQDYFANTLKSSIADTYRTSGSRSSVDWPYEDEEIPSANVEDALFTLSGLTGDRASLNGQQVRVQRNIESQQPIRVYVTSVKAEESYGGNPPFVVNSNNAALTYRDSGNESYYLQLSQVAALASLSTISVD